MSLVLVGYRNLLPSTQFHLLLTIGSPPSKPIKHLISSFGSKGKVIDVGVRRRRRSMIITNDGYAVLSSIGSSTLCERFEESGRFGMNSMISVGHNNFIPIDQIVMVIAVGDQMPSPIARIIQGKRIDNKVIDVTSGRATRSIIVTTTGFFVLSSFVPNTIVKRFNECSRPFKLFGVGNNHYVPTHIVQSISSINSKPNIKFIDMAESTNTLFRLNKGKKRQSFIVLDNGYVVVSSLAAKSLADKLDSFLY
ncbi:extracellular matrix/biofilm biosynthesis regulator RemA family protein [Bacillus bombysepticus]|uniref:extracellular matrix/biofilm biosynthesis regulator RemA family protein n=1 Tax=Bacillus bombysepticus TaxID=658666 RepID=UPI0030165063